MCLQFVWYREVWVLKCTPLETSGNLNFWTPPPLCQPAVSTAPTQLIGSNLCSLGQISDPRLWSWWCRSAERVSIVNDLDCSHLLMIWSIGIYITCRRSTNDEIKGSTVCSTALLPKQRFRACGSDLYSISTRARYVLVDRYRGMKVRVCVLQLYLKPINNKSPWWVYFPVGWWKAALICIVLVGNGNVCRQI